MKQTNRLTNILFLILLISCKFSVAQTGYHQLVWADEFNKAGLPDSTKWGYDIGRGCPNICGWGNNELQYYTVAQKQNVRIENGHLIIEARKERKEDANYTSTRLISKNKGDWKYGRIVVKAKLPKGRGIWPAIWMLPTDWEYGAWPNSGEIDIMENVGYWPDSVLGTIHTGAYNGMLGTQKTEGLHYKDLSTAFHEYSIEWNKDSISFFVDQKKYQVFINDHKGFKTWPFDKRFHLLINIAVGGNWGGKYGVDDSIFPQKMEIDYIRIYQ